MTEPTGGELRRCVKCDAWMLADNLPRHSCESVLSHDAEDTQHTALRALVQQWLDPQMHSRGDAWDQAHAACAYALATLLGDTK